jgi:hypothetical protein
MPRCRAGGKLRQKLDCDPQSWTTLPRLLSMRRCKGPLRSPDSRNITRQAVGVTPRAHSATLLSCDGALDYGNRVFAVAADGRVRWASSALDVPPRFDSRNTTPNPLEVSVDRAVDLPRSQGPTTKRSGAYVEEENAASGAKTKRGALTSSGLGGKSHLAGAAAVDEWLMRRFSIGQYG